VVNTTSALENCETSAWGRALAAAGFEVTKGIASREEMAKVNRQSQAPRQSAPAQASDGTLILPYSKDKGKPITEASTHNLEWVLGTLTPDKLKDPTYGENNKVLKPAIEAELERRKAEAALKEMGEEVAEDGLPF